MIKNYSDKIQFATKMPFQPLSRRGDNQVFIGETEFAIPENESEKVKLYIYLAAPKFAEDALHVSFNTILTLYRRTLASMDLTRSTLFMTLRATCLHSTEPPLGKW